MKENIDKAGKDVIETSKEAITSLTEVQHLLLIQRFCSPVKNMSIFMKKCKYDICNKCDYEEM